MHKWVYEKAECLKDEINEKSFDNLSRENLEEAALITKILKNLVCIDKDYHIVQAMEESENEANMEMIEKYSDYPTKYRKMSMAEYKDMSPEEMRKLDHAAGRMYYTEMHDEHDAWMGRNGHARKVYMETREKHPSNSAEDKQAKIKDLDTYMNELSTDLKEMLHGMEAEERTIMKTKLANIVNTM